MKFGEQLALNAHAPWLDKYIAYERIKRQLEESARSLADLSLADGRAPPVPAPEVEARRNAQAAKVIGLVDEQCAIVNEFYLEQIHAHSQELKVLDRALHAFKSGHHHSQSHAQEQQSATDSAAGKISVAIVAGDTTAASAAVAGSTTPASRMSRRAAHQTDLPRTLVFDSDSDDDDDDLWADAQAGQSATTATATSSSAAATITATESDSLLAGEDSGATVVGGVRQRKARSVAGAASSSATPKGPQPRDRSRERDPLSTTVVGGDATGEARHVLLPDGVTLERHLTTVYGELLKLRLYAELNLTGASKLVKKVDVLLGTEQRRAKMAAIAALDFAHSTELSEQMTRAEYMHLSLTGVPIQNIVQAVGGGFGGGRPSSSGLFTPVFRWIPFTVALIVALILMLVPILEPNNSRAHRCLVLLVFVTILWVAEAVPFFVTALSIPLLVVMMRILGSEDGQTLRAQDASALVFTNFFSSTLMLIIGGFAIAAAVTKYNFARATAHVVQQWIGHRPYLFMLAFMYIALVLSALITNVAAPVLLTAVLTPTVRDMPLNSPFARCMLLAVAFACNIGGMTTVLSSPQNLVAQRSLEVMAPGFPITYLQWVAAGFPFTVVAVLLVWLLLVGLLRPSDVTQVPAIAYERAPWTLAHWAVLGVSAVTVVLWCLFSVLASTFGDVGIIALLPILVFFGAGLLTRADFDSFQWNLVFFLAGGNVLGTAVSNSGLLSVMVNAIVPVVEQQSYWVIIALVAAFMLAVATFVSHTVAAIVLFPIVAKIGVAVGHPQALMLAAAFIDSAAMSFPTSSFPNLNAVMTEDDYGRTYLRSVDFVKYGTLTSILLYALVVSLGFLLFFALF